jgi:translation elongation factor EF-1beta
VTVEVFDKRHLDRVVAAIEKVEGVNSVERMNA